MTYNDLQAIKPVQPFKLLTSVFEWINLVHYKGDGVNKDSH